jgi:hypothetical protein
MKIIKTDQPKEPGLWRAKDVLVAMCATCKQHLPWRMHYDSEHLIGSCCGWVHTAKSYFDGDRYYLSSKKADLFNVRLISKVDG